MKYLFFLNLILFFMSCSTTVPYLENGEKLYNNQMYYEALKVLTEGSRVKPNDVDIQISLKKTQDKVYELELLKIRDTRMSGDIISALNMVREVDKKMQEWSIQTNMDGSQFRKQEILKLFQEFQKQLDILLDKKFVIKAHMELLSFKDLLYSLDVYTSYEQKIISEGQKKCQSLQGENDIYNLFVKRYCAYFNVSYDPEINTNKHKYNVKSVKIIDSSGADLGAYNFLSETEIFSITGGTDVSSQSKISFKYSENTSTIHKNKSYTVEESYWVTEQENYYVSVPYWTTEMKCNYVNTYQPCRNVQVQKTRTITKTRPVKVKKYRDVQKNISFEASRLTQNLLLEGTTFLFIGNQKIQIDNKDKESYYDDFHDFEDTRAGVRPDPLNKKDVFSWKEDMKKKILSNMRDEVVFRWKNSFCSEHGDKKEYMNNVIKCGWINTQSDFLENWSQKEMGLDYQVSKKILGF